jgi:protein-tyrosine phosphatase
MTTDKKFKICFVCLGNICRSPLAHGVFEHLIVDAGLQDRIETHSAGTGDWHVGHSPDARMQATANAKGIQLNSRARQFTSPDFDRFDLILAMDRSNFENLLHLRPAHAPIPKNLLLFRSFDPQCNGNHDVPDPYYGGVDGFEDVFDIVSRTCPEILKHIRAIAAIK